MLNVRDHMALTLAGRHLPAAVTATLAHDELGHRTPMRERPSYRTVVERRQAAQYVETTPRHVEVLTDSGAQAGLLVQWRRPVELPWEGLVVHLRIVEGRWRQVREWLPGGAIQPVTGSSPG